MLEIGIDSIDSAPEILYKDEPVTLTTVLFNKEEKDVTVKSIVYTVNGSQVIGTDSTSRTLKAGGTLTVPFTHTFTESKHMTVTVTAVISYNNLDRSYSKDIVLSIFDKNAEISKIKDVRESPTAGDGHEFVIEGVVTSNASDHDKDTAFFDCIYVQDETGGICCFPVSEDFKIGDKVRIVGYIDYYQGELELQVDQITWLDEGEEAAPIEVSASQVNSREVEGLLVTIKGTVESYEEVNGLIQTIMVKDDADNTARVFIDGYITTGYDVERLFEGNGIVATGLASYDDTWPDTDAFPRIRVRDRKDIVCDDYKIIEGADSTWIKDSEDDLLFVSNAPNEKFDGLYIDEDLVDENLYGRVSGSTKITLPASYLQTLEEGKHTVTIKSTDGSASTNLTIYGVAGGGSGPNDPDPVTPDPTDPTPINPQPATPETKPSENQTVAEPFRHPMTGVDTMKSFRPNIGGIRKY